MDVIAAVASCVAQANTRRFRPLTWGIGTVQARDSWVETSSLVAAASFHLPFAFALVSLWAAASSCAAAAAVVKCHLIVAAGPASKIPPPHPHLHHYPHQHLDLLQRCQQCQHEDLHAGAFLVNVIVRATVGGRQAQQKLELLVEPTVRRRTSEDRYCCCCCCCYMARVDAIEPEPSHPSHSSSAQGLRWALPSSMLKWIGWTTTSLSFSLKRLEAES